MRNPILLFAFVAFISRAVNVYFGDLARNELDLGAQEFPTDTNKFGSAVLAESFLLGEFYGVVFRRKICIFVGFSCFLFTGIGDGFLLRVLIRVSFLVSSFFGFVKKLKALLAFDIGIFDPSLA